jgi:putative endonuclease
MFYVYILYSQHRDKYYVGQTNSLKIRLVRHNRGYVKSTKPYRPWVIVYSEEFSERSQAVQRETQIKSWKSKVKIKELVEASR